MYFFLVSYFALATQANFCEYCYSQFVDAQGCTRLQQALTWEYQTENRECFEEAISWCWQNMCVGDCVADYESCAECKNAFQSHGGCTNIRGTDDLSKILLPGCEQCPFANYKQNCQREGYPEFAPIIPGGMEIPTDDPPEIVHEYEFIPICKSKAPSSAPTSLASLTKSANETEGGLEKWVIVLISMIAATVFTGLCCVFGIYIYRKYRTEAQFEIYAQEATFFDEEEEELSQGVPLTPRLLYVRKSVSKNESDYARKRGVSKSRRRSQLGSTIELPSVITVDEQNLDAAWERLGLSTPRSTTPRGGFSPRKSPEATL